MVNFSPEDIDHFISKYPGFIKSGGEDDSFLSGTVIIEADDKRYDFEVKICPAENYPYRFPKVFELSNKIKRIADWHVNSDESFCFTVEPIEAIACKEAINLLDFYSKWLIPYLSNQQYRINEGKYANGEYSHNFLGLYEYYAELLKAKDIRKLEHYMTFVSSKKKIERTSICYCGSGVKYRHCHKKGTTELLLINEEVLAKHIFLFRSIISKLN